MSFVMTGVFSVRVTKFTSRIGVSYKLTAYLSVFDLF